MWLAIRKPRMFSLSWIINWVRFRIIIAPSPRLLQSLPATDSFFLHSLVVLFQVCIILGVVLMILAPIGGLRQIILSWKNYQFFSWNPGPDNKDITCFDGTMWDGNGMTDGWVALVIVIIWCQHVNTEAALVLINLHVFRWILYNWEYCKFKCERWVIYIFAR